MLSFRGMGLEHDETDSQAVRAPWGEVGRVATLAVIAAASKFWLNVLNTTTIVGLERFQRAALDRAPGQGLLTVSNHTRCASPQPLPAPPCCNVQPAQCVPAGCRGTACAVRRCLKGQCAASDAVGPVQLPVIVAGLAQYLPPHAGGLSLLQSSPASASLFVVHNLVAAQAISYGGLRTMLAAVYWS